MDESEVGAERIKEMKIENDKQADELLAALKEYYHEPVMPISKYCNALRAWANALSDRSYDHPNEKRFADLESQVRHVFLQIQKSNMLYRLLYRGEPARTIKCPKHLGKWSFSFSEICEHGCQLTGWLPEKKEENQLVDIKVDGQVVGTVTMKK